MAHRAATKAPSARRGGHAGLLTVIALLVTVLLVTALPLCMLMVAGMLPSLVAAVVDSNPRRYITISVTIANLGGMVMPGLAFMKLGMTIGGALQVLGDPQNWLVMYGAAGVGWVLNAGMLTVARVVLAMRD